MADVLRDEYEEPDTDLLDDDYGNIDGENYVESPKEESGENNGEIGDSKNEGPKDCGGVVTAEAGD